MKNSFFFFSITRLPPRTAAFDYFINWHVAFYGTTEIALKPILRAGQIPLPGDKTTTTSEQNISMDGFKANENEIILSPSIRYAGHDEYALPNDYTDVDTGDMIAYKAKVVFQVMVEPGSYRVRPARFEGAEDPKFNNQEIEWYTENRGTVMYALLVNLEEK
ncbi:neuralized-like protein 4 [Glandiceps talaboti]